MNKNCIYIQTKRERERERERVRERERESTRNVISTKVLRHFRNSTW